MSDFGPNCVHGNVVLRNRAIYADYDGQKGEAAKAEWREKNPDKWVPKETPAPAPAEKPSAISISTPAATPVLAPKAKEQAPLPEVVPAPAPQPAAEPWRPTHLQKDDWYGVQDSFRKDGHYSLAFYHMDFWEFDGHGYVRRLRQKIEADVRNHLRDEVIGPNSADFKVTRGAIRESLAALESACQQPDDEQSPFWRKSKHHPLPTDLPPARECIALQNVILHAPSGETRPQTPLFFTCNTLGFDYDADAACPTWQRCLGGWFGSYTTPESLLLQEICGYLLTPWTNLQKFFVLVGPGANGKDVIVFVIRALLGKFNAVPISMQKLAGERYNKEPLIDALLAVVTEMAFGRKAERTNVTQFLKTVSGEGEIEISRGQRQSWRGILPVRFLLASNTVPSFDDNTHALERRLVALQFTRIFSEDERDVGLREKLVAELPGIFNWALQGYQRLRANGKFTLPESSAELTADIVMASSGVRPFIDAQCTLQAGAFVTNADLYAAYVKWCALRKEKPLKEGEFIRDVLAALPQVKKDRPKTKTDNGWKSGARGISGLALAQGGES